MKKMKRLSNLRTMIVSAVLIVSVSCLSGVLAAYAAEGTESPDAVSYSDEAEATQEVAAENSEKFVISRPVEIKRSNITVSQTVDAKHYRFKPNATYNGSFRSELIPNEIPIYDALVASMVTNGSNDPVTVDISGMNYTFEQQDAVNDLVISAYAAFSMDYPEVYWIGGYELSMSGSGGILKSVKITPNQRYEGAYSERSTVLSGVNAAVSTISSLRASTSRYDTVKAIHDYICNTMEYDYEAASSGNIGQAHTIAPLFGGGGGRGHKFVCEGYANSFKLLCDKFGIPAVHVKGTAYTSEGDGGHSWNYVQMDDGKWYGVDATWDDQSSLVYTYFLIGSNTTVFNHKIFSEDHVPGNQVMSTDTVNPLVYPPLSTEKYDPTASVPATGISLSQTSLSLTKGNTATLTATVTPSGSTDSVTWTSSNTAVATVSNGVVTAVGNGSATITAKAGSKSATCSVTVTTPATGISLSQTSLSLTKGNTATLTATVTPSGSSDSVTWTSSNTAVATVSNGVVTAVGNGSATITAKAGSKSATCSVTVTTPATGISLSQTSLSLTKGNTATLTATVTPSGSTDSVTWTSSNTAVATVSNGVVTAVGNGSATITAKAGSKSATCSVTVTTPVTNYDVTPNINGGASKLYEPWGLRYFAVFNGEDADKITDRGIAILKETYYSAGMKPAAFCSNQNAHVFLDSRGELEVEAASSTYPKGRYYATLTKGIYSYDIGSKYYVVPFAVMTDGRTIYGTIKSNSMEKILKANLNLSTITSAEKAICTCILELKESVAQHYAATGVPGASVDMDVPRGNSQTAASSVVAAGNGITPNVTSGASRLIEPWGLRYFAQYGSSTDISQRGMVILNAKYYNASYSTSPDAMRLNPNAYVFRDSDGTLAAESGTSRYFGTLTEGISSKDIADVYYVVPFVVKKNGSYVYGSVKSNSMMKIMQANLNSSSVPETERAVSEDIIALYNAVKAYYEAQ
ncbi:MAG: Ig-like domain-containing protein [Clostridia bacterium]|nr:Ig-like domain-containing protein [Clostridia bacterium]